MPARVRRALPYIVAFVIAAVLFAFANRIQFEAPGGRMGPDFWPKLILGLALVTCAFEIVRTLFFDAGEQVGGVLESILEEAPTESVEDEKAAKLYPRLLLAGVGLTIGYVIAIQWLGFFLCTFLYMAAFAWIGRYRRPVVIVVSSLVGSLAFMFVFMKVVYVSLPLGQGPFAQVTFFLMRMMGIR